MKFEHPTIEDGAVSQGDESWPIEDSIVDCPEAIGRDHGWKKLAQSDPRAKGPAPTLEEYMAAGYKAETYPPRGFAEVPSPALEAFRRLQAKLEILKGSVPDIQGALSVEITTLEDLQLLEDAELAGKARKGVLDAIAAHRLELQTQP